MNFLARSRSKIARFSRILPMPTETTLITTLLLQLLRQRGVATKRSKQKCLISTALLLEALRSYTSAPKMWKKKQPRSRPLHLRRCRGCLRNSQTPVHHYPQRVRDSMLKIKIQVQALCQTSAVRNRSKAELPMDSCLEFQVRVSSNSNTATLTNRSLLAYRRNCLALRYNRTSLTKTNQVDRWMMLDKCLFVKDLHRIRE
jgi:hypothetical protein